MKFSFDTIENFDNHINLSIPGYSNLVHHVVRIASYFLKKDCTVYDFGCSTGALITKLKEMYKTPIKYIGIDNSPNMVNKNPFILNEDLVQYTPEVHKFSTLIFTLQFIEIKHRLSILKKIYNSLDEDGALIVAEKVFINDGFLQDLFNFTYYDFKLENFDEKTILKKQMDLRTIMRPLSEDENIKLFKDAGFTRIQPFWQSLQFKAWVLLK